MLKKKHLRLMVDKLQKQVEDLKMEIQDMKNKENEADMFWDDDDTQELITNEGDGEIEIIKQICERKDYRFRDLPVIIKISRARALPPASYMVEMGKHSELIVVKIE